MWCDMAINACEGTRAKPAWGSLCMPKNNVLVDRRRLQRSNSIGHNESFKLELPRLGNPWTVNGLKCVIRREVPKVVFLCKSRCSEAHIAKVKGQLGFPHALVVNNNGCSGGPCLLLHEELVIRVK